MHPTYHIHYLRRKDIDPEKWDACIHRAPNGLIYGKTFFLDRIADEQWDALVLEDYQAVMPLTWRKKFGFTYLYQPFFTPALGIFGTPGLTSAFLAAIPSRFRYWEIDLNESNRIDTEYAATRPIKIAPRINYLLSLHRPYEAIRYSYKRLAKRMLQQAAGNGLQVIRDARPEEVIGHFQNVYRSQLPGIRNKDYLRLTACAGIASRDGHCAAYLAQTPDNKPSAFYLVFSDERCVYSTLGGSTEEGKKNGAFYLLTDAVIRDHADTNRTFRFEGSDLSGIAFFNSQFGSSPVIYPHITMNKLPFPVNLLKRS